ncbi:glutathione S-transferase C-terminal domain-containing protein [Roseobacter cerasinus]|uniref:glutathione S-transferase C-terminal domain-containing protein n=1 Tax=Roseobacter cerasinus TaxID=2602289 RepID=UPI0034D5EE2B
MWASNLDATLKHTTWDTAQQAVDILGKALEGQTWLLGDQFTAAHVAIGSVIVMARFNDFLPKSQIVDDYVERLRERPAFQQAEKLTWPPELFPN